MCTHRRLNRRWSGRLASAVGALLMLASVSPGQENPGEVAVTRDRSFRIPYSVDPGQQANLKEVQLYVSVDRGRNWRPVVSGPPSSEFFTYTAQGDGEHWFAVRTIDLQGRGDPPSMAGIGAGLVIQVDTVPPQVQLRGVSPSGDEMGVEWDVYDPNLDVASMRLEFRVGASNDWFPIRVQPSPSGRTSFRPGARGPIEIRLRVLDRAGNEGLAQRTLDTLAPNPAAATGLVPPATAARGMNSSGITPAFPTSSSRPTGQVQPAPTSSPAGDFTVPPPPDLNSRFVANPNQDSNAAASPNLAAPTAPGLVPPGTPMLGTGRPVPPTSSGSSAADPRYPSPAQAMPSAPAKANIQLVNSLRFGVNYAVAEVGRSGLGSVSLYWTYDGMQWNYQGDDEDRESPFPIEVDGEGVFGFKLVPRSVAGLGDEPPQAGDQADVWVEVDITPPVIELAPPQPGRGATSGILDIQWRATERNPAPKPIGIYYSESASGPWKSVAEGIENSGRYQWAIPDDPKMPYKFFVRLECKDRAGNMGRAETSQPVIVDMTKPRLKILTVESSSKSNFSVTAESTERPESQDKSLGAFPERPVSERKPALPVADKPDKPAVPEPTSEGDILDDPLELPP